MGLSLARLYVKKREKETNLKSINIWISREVYVKLKMLSVATGVPMYKIVAKFLNEGMKSYKLEDIEKLKD